MQNCDEGGKWLRFTFLLSPDRPLSENLKTPKNIISKMQLSGLCIFISPQNKTFEIDPTHLDLDLFWLNRKKK